MDLNKLREITEKLNRSELLKGHAYPVLDLFIKQQEQALILPVVSRTFKEKQIPTFDEWYKTKGYYKSGGSICKFGIIVRELAALHIRYKKEFNIEP